MLKNIKLRGQLLLGFGLIIVIMLCMAIFSFSSQARLNNHLDSIINTNFVNLETVNNISVLRSQILRNLSEFINASAPDQIDSLSKSIQGDIESIRSSIAKLESINTNSEILHPLAELKTSFDQWLNIYDQEMSLKRAKRQSDLVTYVNTKGKEAFDAVTEKVSNLLNATKAHIEEIYQSALTTQKTTIYITLLINAIGILLAIILAFIIGANIVLPIKQLIKNLTEVSEGNLQQHLQGNTRKDEIGMLVRSFESFLDRFREQIAEINSMVLHLSSSASEMSATSAQLGSSSSETATSIVETAATTEEIRQIAQTSKELSLNVTESTDQTYALSKESLNTFLKTVENIEKLNTQMNAVSQSLLNLSEQSQMIAEIIASVDDIAEQSNLLAVNAAIEAAKAGDQGKGFAVVAQEVKLLADQSKQSTRQVRKILSDIQKATSGALLATEQENKEILQGSERINQTNAAMKTIADAVSKSAQLVQQIAYAIDQQFTGIDQISTAMNNVKTASAQNAEAARNLEQVAASISDSGNKLKSLVERYKL